MVMEEILSELKITPGVLGGFFIHRKNGVLCADLPSVYQDLNLNDMGRQLSKIYAARRLNFPEVHDIGLYFAEAVMISRAIDEQFFLVLLCDQDVNSSTLSVSMHLAIEEHDDELSLAAAGQLADGLSGGAQQLSSQQVLDGPLKQPLEKIQRTLIEMMGPMAELLYEESLERWVASGRIREELLPEFIELIAREMPDDRKATAFKDACRNISFKV